MEWDSGFIEAKQGKPLTREEEIMAAWTAEAMCLEGVEPVRGEYRASSMPICGHYLELMAGKEEVVKGQKDFYTGIGTVIHELLQDRFPLTRNGGAVFGNWQCENGNCKHFHVECVYPKTCVQCGSSKLRYKEVELTYRGVIGMHVDLLIKLRNGNFWLNDWKTCGPFALEKPEYLGLPYPKNVAQVGTYFVALREEKGIVVEHAFLDYTLRGEPEDDPKKPKNRPYGFKVTPELYRDRKQQLDRIVEEKRAFERFKASRTLANLQAFDKLRPCHKPSDYKDRVYGMEAHFQYKDAGCPFANAEGCFKTGLSKPARLLAEKLKGSNP